MAEFDSVGLQAVAKFFGQDSCKTTEKNDDRKTQVYTPVPTGRRSRLGLGATARSRIDVVNDGGNYVERGEVKQKLLKVGNKSGKRGFSELEEEVNCGGSQSESDKEEEGRTSAFKAKEKSTDLPIAEQEAPAVKKKKKKAGRKERLAAAVATADAEKKNAELAGPCDEDRESFERTVTTERTFDDVSNAEASVEPKIDAARHTQEAKKKRKRTKVRSRQKNIRKDNRAAMDKPGRGTLGRANFTYRPLTPETRAYLNLPQSNTSKIQSFHGKHQHNAASGDGLEKDGDVGLGLAVEEFLGGEVEGSVDKQAGKNGRSEDEDLVSATGVGVPEVGIIKPREPRQTKTKQKRKKKYKNLM